MNTFETFLVVAIWAAIALALLPIGLAWKRHTVRNGEGQGNIGKVILLVATVSYAWFLGLLLLPDVFGSHYSELRYATIFLNLAAGVISIGFAVLYLRRVPLVRVTTVWVAALWCYMLVVSSVA